MIYTDTMFNLSGAAATTLTAMNSGIGATAGNYSAPLNGRLVKVTLTLVPQAASSLAEHGRVHLTQSNWSPNVSRYWVPGFGLQTVAGRGSDGNQRTHDFVTDLQVKTDWPITGEVIYPGTGPVTPTMIVTGTFVT
jgi:hypothetical protein